MRMKMGKVQVCAAIALMGLGGSGVARAADTKIAAGQAFTLPASLVLAGSDHFTAGHPTGARCVLHGGGFAISSAPDWTGPLLLRNCHVDGLGHARPAAVQI